MAPARLAIHTGGMPHPAPLIAILDDEDHFRKALSRLLSAHGYRVQCFARGQDLAAAVTQRPFDCVLVDLNMPGMSGFDVLAELQGELRPPPVIVVTANDDAAAMKRAFALNAFDYRVKPVAAPGLLDSIERALRRPTA